MFLLLVTHVTDPENESLLGLLEGTKLRSHTSESSAVGHFSPVFPTQPWKDLHLKKRERKIQNCQDVAETQVNNDAFIMNLPCHQKPS